MIERLRIIILFAIALWMIEFINIGVGHSLNTFGIVPRYLPGLRGIVFAPFLHGNPQHLAANTAPLLILGFFVLAGGVSRFVFVSLTIAVLGGMFVWCFGRDAVHIGASGLIFGWFGYLVADGLYSRSVRSVLLAVATVMIYGGLIFGVLPSAPYISWEAHLGGLLAGIFAARTLGGARRGGR